MRILSLTLGLLVTTTFAQAEPPEGKVENFFCRTLDSKTQCKLVYGAGTTAYAGTIVALYDHLNQTSDPTRNRQLEVDLENEANRLDRARRPIYQNSNSALNTDDVAAKVQNGDIIEITYFEDPAKNPKLYEHTLTEQLDQLKVTKENLLSSSLAKDPEVLRKLELERHRLKKELEALRSKKFDLVTKIESSVDTRFKDASAFAERLRSFTGKAGQITKITRLSKVDQLRIKQTTNLSKLHFSKLGKGSMAVAMVSFGILAEEIMVGKIAESLDKGSKSKIPLVDVSASHK